MKEVQIYEGIMARPEDEPAATPTFLIQKVDAKNYIPIGQRVRITIETIDEGETFEEVIGAIPPEVIADERDELES
jgi:hypothetical protein